MPLSGGLIAETPGNVDSDDLEDFENDQIVIEPCSVSKSSDPFVKRHPRVDSPTKSVISAKQSVGSISQIQAEKAFLTLLATGKCPA